MATLVFHLDDEREIVVPLVASVSLGSAEGNDVLVEDGSIAARHAEVALSPTGSFVVRDLGSTTGTFVNGRRVTVLPLCEGDEVSFGRLRGRFVLDEQDRTVARQREQRERERRKEVEKLEKDYEEALARHKLVLGLLQGLGEEERKRMGNLDDLQRAVNRAETVHAAAETAAEKARHVAAENEARHAALQADIEKLQAEHTELAAKNKALVAAEQQKLDALTRRLGEEQSLAQSKLDAIAAKHNAAKDALSEAEAKCAETAAMLTQHRDSLTKLQAEINAAETKRWETQRSITAGEAALALIVTQQQTAQQAAEKETAALKQAQERERQSLQDQTKVLQQTQEKERETLQKIEDERKKAEAALARLTAQQTKLTTTVAALDQSVKDMTQRQTEGLLSLRERERSFREVLKGIENCQADQKRIQAEIRQHETQRDEVQASIVALIAEADERSSAIGALDETVKGRKEQIEALDHRIQQLQADRDLIQARVKSLTGTEEQLLHAKQELATARQEHATLVALVASRDQYQRELDETKARLAEHREFRAEAEADLTKAETALEEFQRLSAAEQQRLRGETQTHQEETDARRAELAAVTSQLQASNTRHQELLRLNRELDGVDDKLRKANADLKLAQHQQAETNRRTVILVRESEEARTKLQGLQEQVKTLVTTLERHRSTETAITKVIAKLKDEQAAEDKHLADLRRQTGDAEKKAAADRAALAAEFEKRRRDILNQEDQYHAIVSLRAELDALYTKIESSSEDPATALATWKEAQRKKEELANLMPKEGGIRARPQVRTVLVPRSKEG